MSENTYAVLMPVFDPNDEVAVITKIFYPSGQRVEKGSIIFLVESAKGQWELTADVTGWLEFSLAEGDRFATGSQIAVIHSTPSVKISGEAKSAPASHITRKAAKLMRNMNSITERAVRSSVLPQTTVKESEIRKLERSGNNQFLSSVSMDFSLAEIEKHVAKVTGGNFISGPAEYISYRASIILPRFSALNGFFEAGKAFAYHEVNLGYAMNLNNLGLKVVTVRTPTESYRDFCMKLQGLTYAYLQNSLKPQDLVGSTFTISNMFNFGIDHFLPLLSEGQSGILGIASPNSAGYFKVILSFDHRMLDAVLAAEFLKLLKTGAE